MADTEPGPHRTDRSLWNLLLIPPIVIPLLTFLFNKDKPRLAGFPFFYWMQFAFILLGIVCTAIVYLMTRRTPSDVSAARED